MSSSLLYKSAFILGVSSLLSRLLGVVRDHLLARFFGIGGEGIYNLDVYYSAFRVPDFIYALLIMGTVAAAFVPILTGIMHKERSVLGRKKMSKEASLFASNVLNTISLSIIVASGVAFVLAPWIVRFLVPGFEAADFELTVMVTRLMLVSPIFFGLSSVLQSVQNAFDRFFYYALAPILYNLGIVCGIVFFAEEYGVWAVAGGVIFGAFMHFLIQIPGVHGLKFRYSFHISWKDSHLREMIRLVIPRIIGISAAQINLIFDTLVGSLLAAGSITVLNYAVNLNSLPMGMIGVSFAIASFATLSGLAFSSREKFASQLSRVVTSVLYFVIPSTVGLFVLRFSIVDLILGNGEFTDRDVLITANVLSLFLIGLVGQSLIPVFVRAFYSFKNTFIPVTISIVSMILNICLNFYLALEIGMGVYGIALATSIASLLNAFLLAVFLRRKFLPGMSFVKFGRVGGIVFASLVMGVAVYFVNQSLIDWGMISVVNKTLALGASVVVGVIVFLLAILPFGLMETRIILRKFSN